MACIHQDSKWHNGKKQEGKQEKGKQEKGMEQAGEQAGKTQELPAIDLQILGLCARAYA